MRQIVLRLFLLALGLFGLTGCAALEMDQGAMMPLAQSDAFEPSVIAVPEISVDLSAYAPDDQLVVPIANGTLDEGIPMRAPSVTEAIYCGYRPLDRAQTGFYVIADVLPGSFRPIDAFRTKLWEPSAAPSQFIVELTNELVTVPIWIRRVLRDH